MYEELELKAEKLLKRYYSKYFFSKNKIINVEKLLNMLKIEAIYTKMPYKELIKIEKNNIFINFSLETDQIKKYTVMAIWHILENKNISKIFYRISDNFDADEEKYYQLAKATLLPKKLLEKELQDFNETYEKRNFNHFFQKKELFVNYLNEIYNIPKSLIIERLQELEILDFEIKKEEKKEKYSKNFELDLIIFFIATAK